MTYTQWFNDKSFCVCVGVCVRVCVRERETQEGSWSLPHALRDKMNDCPHHNSQATGEGPPLLSRKKKRKRKDVQLPRASPVHKRHFSSENVLWLWESWQNSSPSFPYPRLTWLALTHRLRGLTLCFLCTVSQKARATQLNTSSSGCCFARAGQSKLGPGEECNHLSKTRGDVLNLTWNRDRELEDMHERKCIWFGAY